VNAITGQVKELRDEPEYEDGERGYRDIRRVDVVEWCKHYDDPSKPPLAFTGCDILDVGYWYLTPDASEMKYEEPAHEWRAEYRRKESA